MRCEPVGMMKGRPWSPLPEELGSARLLDSWTPADGFVGALVEVRGEIYHSAFSCQGEEAELTASFASGILEGSLQGYRFEAAGESPTHLFFERKLVDPFGPIYLLAYPAGSVVIRGFRRVDGAMRELKLVREVGRLDWLPRPVSLAWRGSTPAFAVYALPRVEYLGRELALALVGISPHHSGRPTGLAAKLGRRVAELQRAAYGSKAEAGGTTLGEKRVTEQAESIMRRYGELAALTARASDPLLGRLAGLAAGPVKNAARAVVAMTGSPGGAIGSFVPTLTAQTKEGPTPLSLQGGEWPSSPCGPGGHPLSDLGGASADLRVAAFLEVSQELGGWAKAARSALRGELGDLKEAVDSAVAEIARGYMEARPEAPVPWRIESWEDLKPSIEAWEIARLVDLAIRSLKTGDEGTAWAALVAAAGRV